MASGPALNDTPPFVLTLELDGESFARLNEARRRYFPPERNQVPAHLTLFHQLPGERGREIKALLRQVAAGRKPIEMQRTELKALEGGVALFVQSPQLGALRDELAAEWDPWLIAQDRAGFRPHVTIQNKVGAAEARKTLAEASATLRLRALRGVGLHLWRYRGGPWEDAQLFRFG